MKSDEMDSVGRGAMQGPAAKFVFGQVDGRHREKRDIVHRHRDRRRDLVAATNPRHTDGQQCFKTIERREAEKNSDGRTKCDRVRCVTDRHQRHVVFGQPVFKTCQRIG